MKKKRHAKILELVGKEEIETQEELLKRLAVCGFTATQATISRDIKELRLVKIPSPSGKYKYAVGGTADDAFIAKLHAIFSESVISVDFAGNTVVLKCLSGMAQAAAAAIDAMKFSGVVGTLAGDDTIFTLCRDEAHAVRLAGELRTMSVSRK